ncbi:uncharacterized protein LOC133227554 [Bos javanicus]|uniref:uncharacterized protein LOC133227554 n=1 Tax=Bos javanicus TaxID=9906 RepID=UPI002AA7174F|nr:uncharacterized protein LOC133227554 [Bos javanicus]
MGNLNCCSGGCFVWKTKKDIPQSSRTLKTSWVKRVHCWPHSRMHPITDPVEELPEDELSTSNLEEEALPTGAVKETNKNAPQEDLVEELPQACAEEQPLSMLKAHGVVYEHDPLEDPVVELCRDWAKEQSLSTLKAYGAVCEHDFTKDLIVNPACDRTEEIPCDSKVALSACASDCFLESVSSSDTEDNADSPHDYYPQTSEKCMEDNKDSEIESKNTEISENSLLVCWRNVFGGIKDNKEDQEKQE